MKQLIGVNLSPEELFILLICRSVSTDKSIATINDFLKKNLNWNLILQMVRRHEIAGPLYVALSQCSNIGNVPNYLLEKLEKTSRFNALRNLFYSKAFIEIVANFNRANIKTIPLKGIEFLYSIYVHNIALRSLNDIDILVEKENVPRAEGVLIDMGYEKKRASFRVRQRHFHSNFVGKREKQPIMVELHWDLDFSDSTYNIDIKEFWERSQEISSRQFNCYGFSIEDNIIFNSFHILREIRRGPDEFLALKNFCDIATIITQSGDKINWDYIVQRSQEYNVIRPVLFVLMFVRDLLRVQEIPEAVIDAIYDMGYRDNYGYFAVKEYIFPSQNHENKLLPFWACEIAEETTLRGKARVFISFPKNIQSLYNYYYGGLQHSAIKSVLLVSYYYTKKIIKTAASYIFVPRKTKLSYKKMILSNQKSKEVIDWIRG